MCCKYKFCESKHVHGLTTTRAQAKAVRRYRQLPCSSKILSSEEKVQPQCVNKCISPAKEEECFFLSIQRKLRLINAGGCVCTQAAGSWHLTKHASQHCYHNCSNSLQQAIIVQEINRSSGNDRSCKHRSTAAYLHLLCSGTEAAEPEQLADTLKLPGPLS